MSSPKWVQRLQERWNLKSAWQVVLVLLAFACTGTTVLFIKEPLLDFLGISEKGGWIRTVLYLLAVLPLYNILLLAYGAVFGQFRFFWEFEKRTLRRILKLFRRK